MKNPTFSRGDSYFTLKVTKPVTVAGTPVYKVYILDASNTVVTSTNNYSTYKPGGYIEVTAGTPITIKLKHNERLSFTDLPVGAKYEVTEAAAVDYTAKIALTVNGVNSSLGGVTPNTSLSSGTNLIGELANSAAYTNTYKTLTPTGLDINDLPFVMMLVLAAGALVTFVAVKSRKKTQASNS